MNTNYIIIGDSIVYGIGDFQNNGWTSLFKNFIINKDSSKVSTNLVHIAGYPGATSSDILNKIESILNCFKNNEFNNTVILSIGVNDTQEFKGKNRISLDQYIKNMKEIIKFILNNSFHLILLGLTSIESDKKFYWKPDKYYDNKTIIEYNSSLIQLINSDSELTSLYNNHNFKYVSMIDVLQKNDYIDGLHPSSIGHKKIFERIVTNL